jgi:hypothetical protein
MMRLEPGAGNRARRSVAAAEAKRVPERPSVEGGRGAPAPRVRKDGQEVALKLAAAFGHIPRGLVEDRMR